jgi:hypothetical protein
MESASTVVPLPGMTVKFTLLLEKPLTVTTTKKRVPDTVSRFHRFFPEGADPLQHFVAAPDARVEFTLARLRGQVDPEAFKKATAGDGGRRGSRWIWEGTLSRGSRPRADIHAALSQIGNYPEWVGSPHGE